MPQRKPIIAANWKMYKTAAEAEMFVKEVKEKLPANDMVESVICAPFTALPALSRAVEGTPIRTGAQNMHWETEGAFTGEISPLMLKEWQITYVVIGHSERRQYFNESDEMVNRKVHAAFQHDLIPIVCVGENLQERESGETGAVIRRQTEAAIKGLNAHQCARLVIAYEPIWAIGSGKSSTPQDAAEQIGFIRSVLRESVGAEAAEQVRIQYGGSVKPENIDGFLNETEIDGALVGGASLKAESFLSLVKSAATKES